MNQTTDSGPITIDVRQVLASRLGRRVRYVPRFVTNALERLICQRQLNELLRYAYPRRGADFCEAVLKHLDVTIDVKDSDRLPANSRCIFVSNHPLGGLDGMAMIAWLSRRYNSAVHFVVNDLLMAVEPLTDCFIPVNKHGAQSRSTADNLDSVLAGNDPVIIYPAGLCSRRQPDGTIADRKWNKMFVNKAIASQRDIVPIYFGGTNSDGFYRAAARRERLGIKFNIEMILLPREIFRQAGRTFTVCCGTPVAWQSLAGGTEAVHTAATLRRTVYDLAQQ